MVLEVSRCHSVSQIVLNLKLETPSFWRPNWKQTNFKMISFTKHVRWGRCEYNIPRTTQGFLNTSQHYLKNMGHSEQTSHNSVLGCVFIVTNIH
jgi:hypothetical protein